MSSMLDLKSTTPIAEYLDMLYTRLAIEMPKHEHITNWWVELHPPHRFFDRPEEEPEGVGYVEIHAMGGGKRLTYRASMHAVQMGAQVSTEVLQQVVEHHVAKFMEAMAP